MKKVKLLSLILTLSLILCSYSVVHAQDNSSSAGANPESNALVGKDLVTGEELYVDLKETYEDFCQEKGIDPADTTNEAFIMEPTFPEDHANDGFVFDQPDEVNSNLINPQTIIGRDERSQANPYSQAICYLEITFPNGNITLGTAYVQLDKLVMTAGHNLYQPGWGGYAKSVKIQPARKDSSIPHGTFSAKQIFVPIEYENRQDTNYDFGLLILNTGIASRTGTLGYNPNAVANMQVTVNGYPADNSSRRYQQWYHSGPLSGIQTHRIFYYLDTSSGQSGAPVYDSQYRVVGIHTGVDGSPLHYVNHATRMTSYVISFIEACRGM